MPARNLSERDFELKTTMRSILWGQGYSTRIDVLLAYEVDPRARGRPGKAGLTDLDVLGVRLDPGFRLHRVVADCKTTRGQVPERLFWLAGVGQFFGSDSNILVRSQRIPEHAPALARQLKIGLAGPEDLAIMYNIYATNESRLGNRQLAEFLSGSVLAESLTRLDRLPEALSRVKRYRESGYWMEPPHARLQHVIVALQHLARDGSRGPTFHLVFADFVWLYVLAIWEACEYLSMNGFHRVEDGLRLYLGGGDSGLQNLQRNQRAFESLARRAKLEVSLSLDPPYFRELAELILRCLRRPVATAKMARRAEWLVVGQQVTNLGAPPWPVTEDDLIAEKLLSDVAAMLATSSGLDNSFSASYSQLLTSQPGEMGAVISGELVDEVPDPGPSDVSSVMTDFDDRLAHEEVDSRDASTTDGESTAPKGSAPPAF